MGSNLPYTDPWAVLGVSRGASRDDVKAAFRRAALQCHPDVDPSPQANARFAEIKAAADMLLKAHQPSFPASASAAAAGAAGSWDPAAAASRAAPRNRTGALWAGAGLAFALAFVYGAFWARYLQRSSNYATPEEVAARLRNPSPQRRKLLAVLLADQQQQQKRMRQAVAVVEAGVAAAPNLSEEEGLGSCR